MSGDVRRLEGRESNFDQAFDIPTSVAYPSRGSKMGFHQALDLIFELNEMTSAKYSNNAQDSLAFFFTKLSNGQLIDGLPCDGIDMVIKDLDLDPKIDAMMRDFLKISFRSFAVLPGGRTEQVNE
ncbi:hypothetical protein Tco_0836994 [Tanacetum coccineum]